MIFRTIRCRVRRIFKRTSKAMHLRTVFSSLIGAAAYLAASATSLADHHHGGGVWRDHDHDGHYNFKQYDYGNHGHYGHYGYPYYGGYGYGYGGGYGWYRPYYWYPSVGLSLYNSDYSRYSRYSYSDNLASNVQRALRSHGYYGGPIDGDIGSGSRSAIRNYQRDHGLGVTGRIDTALLRSLRVG